jgi:type I restriction enzyme S subunit
VRWPTATLDELCDINIGRTPARANPLFWGVGEPWLSIADMNQGREITKTKEQISSAGAAGGRQVLPGTILLSFKLSIGKVARAGIPLYTNEAIAALPIKRADLITEDFLMRALERADLAGDSNRAAMGATLNKAKLKGVSIPLPPLSEQRRFAAILDHADTLRAKRRQVLTHLDALARSVFHDMFGHPMTDDRWPARRLGDLARIVRGASPRPAGDPRYFGGEVPWLKISDFTAETGPVVRTIKESVTEAGRAKSVLLPPHTLVLTNSATVGVPRIVEPATCIHDGFLAFLDLAEDVDRTWLWAALAASRPQLVALAPEGTQKNLNGPIVKAMEFGVPPLDRQRQFVARLDAVTAERNAVKRATATEDGLFESLQSRAFRGEL